MRALEANKATIYYANFVSKSAILDDYGNDTGEYEMVYSEATPFKANIYGLSGMASPQFFGLLEKYDRTLVVDRLPDGLDERSILWVETDTDNPHDYVVKRVIASLNSWTIGLSKVIAGA